MIVFPSNLVHGVTPFITSIWEDLILRKRRRTISINADIIETITKTIQIVTHFLFPVLY